MLQQNSADVLTFKKKNPDGWSFAKYLNSMVINNNLISNEIPELHFLSSTDKVKIQSGKI
jgi:hypothetical protein